MHETRPVLIVGAGPTGLMAALELARMKVPVRLVDQYVEPPTTSRALAVQSRTVELLHQRGIAAEMVALGNRGLAASLYDGATRLGRIALDEVDSRFNFVLLLAQSEIEAGRLVCPFSDVLVSKNAFYLVCHDSQAELGKIAAFRQWIQASSASPSD